MRDAQRSEEGIPLAEQALTWHVRLKDPIATKGDRAAFEAWMSADPRHREAYEEAGRLWASSLVPAQALGADGWYRAAPAPRRFSPRLAFASIAILAVLSGVALWRDPGLLDRALADHSTAPGQHAEIVLADGTRAYLDGDSAISVSITPERREVVLRRGRAWFDVAHRPDPTFRVLAGDVVARDIGTAFSVERGAEVTLVTVEQGEVAVSLAGRPDETRLLTGQRMRIANGVTRATETVDPGVELAWRRGLVVFDRAPLSAVVEQMDRMHAGRVLLRDRELGRLTLSGIFRADDQEAVLAALRTGLGLSTTRIPGLAVLISR